MTYLQQQHKQQHQQHGRKQQSQISPPIHPHDAQKHRSVDTRLNPAHISSALPQLALPTNGATMALARRPDDQVREEEQVSRPNGLQQHEQQHATVLKGHVTNYWRNKETDHEDDSEYGEEAVQKDGVDYDDDDDSDIYDSDSDYDSESEGGNGDKHTETERSTRISEISRSPDAITNSTIDTCQQQAVFVGASVDSTHDLCNMQRAPQDLIMKMNTATDTWSQHRVAHNSPIGNGSRSSHSNSSSLARDGGRSRLMVIEEEKTLTDNVHQDSPRMPRWKADKASCDSSSTGSQRERILAQQAQDRRFSPGRPSNGSSPAVLPHEAKARMMPYVEDDDEDEYDEGSEEYDEDDEEDYEEEDDYSYSEEDDEDDEDDEDEEGSSTEYHYGAREDPGTRSAKSRSSQSPHYSRSGYSHYRPPRLDENFLQKRAITKEVVRRSSLTALLGEAAQPEIQPRNTTIHMAGTLFEQQPRHNNYNTNMRRPAISSAWTNEGPAQGVLQRSGSGDGGEKMDNKKFDHGVLFSQNQQPPVESTSALNLQEPNRPRRTDSGVEVKLSPHLQRDPANSESGFDDKKLHPYAMNAINSAQTSSPQEALANEVSHAPSIAIAPTLRLRVKSEGDSSDEEQLLLVSSSLGIMTTMHSQETGAASGSSPLQTRRPPLKSSISSHTFPRAAGKRTGRKHVSWHHSLFPTERVLRVKPSLPSLSTVAAESAKATLSQLPSIPVMARDNVKDFHQSIRSLRALSRDEIAKMSYKQQGRQELTSPIPISKSVVESIPWWSPSRWLKGSATVDKRHWKPDSSRESCAFCFAPFHRISNPRHHCRKCGDLFCGKCASAEILMDAKNCVYVQQSQLARWSRRVDIQRHSLWIDTLPQLHPVRTAVESALVSGVSGADGHGSIGHSGGMNNGLNGMGHRGSVGSAGGSGRRGSWQMGPAAIKKSRLSVFGLFGNGAPGTTTAATGNTPSISSDSRRGSMDLASCETVFANHYGHLQPHSQNPMAATFSVGRRSSSSSIMRSSTVNGPSHLIITSGALGSNENSSTPIAMSRRMSSGGVGEICLARICVGCERELLKPVPRCTSIAKYYGSLSSRNGYRRQGYGYSSLGPHVGRSHLHPHPQHTGPQPMDETESTVTVHQGYLSSGLRRHSPLRQASFIDQMNGYSENHANSRDPYEAGARAGYEHCTNAGWNPREEPVGPHGERRHHPSVLTFQEQQLHYTQQTQGPLCREMC
ncbi:hypothetical protein BGX28_005187 [Mortierella sp. GBA30]|nr:hypothetical protein BGX28_005187 [Mortierella sp. GBA30]